MLISKKNRNISHIDLSGPRHNNLTYSDGKVKYWGTHLNKALHHKEGKHMRDMDLHL
jgi:hypothetical protein